MRWATGFLLFNDLRAGTNQVRYVTSIERYAFEQGRQEGRREGIRLVLVNTLRFRFEQLPDGMVEALETIIDLDTLDALHGPAIRAGSIEEFQQSLATAQN